MPKTNSQSDSSIRLIYRFISILLFICFLLHPSALFSQDIIFLEDGEEIQAIVEEIAEETIKYKEYEFQDGPVRSISVARVSRIVYSNGREEVISNEKIRKKLSRKLENNKDYGAVGLGLGSSYGGTFGIKAQYAFGEKFKVGPHVGIGYESSVGTTFSGGASLYLKNFYLDLIYGPVVFENVDWDEDYEETHYGPSANLGYDWYFSNNFGLNIALGLGYWSGNEYYDSETVLTLDFGFKYKFK